MELKVALGIAGLFTIMAVDLSGVRIVFWRHALALEEPVDVSVVGSHVPQGLEACGALVRSPGMLLVTIVVNGVATPHEDDRSGRGEHKLVADGAIGLEIPLNTSVLPLQCNTQTHVTCVAVEKVLAKSPANAADPALVTMVDVLPLVIIPKLAYITVVMG